MSVHSSSLRLENPAVAVPHTQNSPLINHLPSDVALKILNKTTLSDYERARCREVCVLWKNLIKMPEEINVKVFGKEAWKKFYGYNTDHEIPSPPDKVIEIVLALRRRLKDIRNVPTCSLLLMPKGLTLSILKGLVQGPFKGEKITFRASWERIFDEDVDKPIDESYWVLMTNGVIKRNKNFKYDQQHSFIAQLVGDRWQATSILELAVCAFMNFTSSGKYFFSKNPHIFTTCRDKIEDMVIVAGGFCKEGLCIDRYPSIFIESLYNEVAICRKF